MAWPPERRFPSLAHTWYRGLTGPRRRHNPRRPGHAIISPMIAIATYYLEGIEAVPAEVLVDGGPGEVAARVICPDGVTSARAAGAYVVAIPHDHSPAPGLAAAHLLTDRLDDPRLLALLDA